MSDDQSVEEMGETVQTLSILFLKILTEGAGMTEAESTFQYFSTLTEKADPLLQW